MAMAAPDGTAGGLANDLRRRRLIWSSFSPVRATSFALEGVHLTLGGPGPQSHGGVSGRGRLAWPHMKKPRRRGDTRGFSGSLWGEPMTGEGQPRHLRALAPIEGKQGLIMRCALGRARRRRPRAMQGAVPTISAALNEIATNLVNDAVLPVVGTCVRHACDCCTCCCQHFILIERLLASSSGRTS